MQTMSIPTISSNALKWTPEVVKDLLIKIELIAHDEDVIYLGHTLMRHRISRKAWSYWKKKFADIDDIMDHMDIIEGIFEVKMFDAAWLSKIPAAVAIFALKNNHHWTDRPQTEPVAELPARMPMLIELDEHTIIAVP